jgi:hypothetical protein
VSHPHLAVLAATLPMRALGSSQALSHPRGFQGKPTGVEPNPIYHDELQRLRSCKLLPTCASNSTEEVELTLPTDTWIGALGGINGGRMREYEKQISHKERASVAKRLRCVRVGDELRRLGVRHVDLFSLDVEGHERKVLDGIDICRRGLRLEPACITTGPRCVTSRVPCECSVVISHIVCEANCAEVLGRWGYVASKPRGLLGSEVLWTRPSGVLETCRRIQRGSD